MSPALAIRKLLIANRGEIAVRVIRACRDLGIVSVAVYSEADRGALHVRLADEAYCCGGPRAADSYLAIDNLLEIAGRCGADAVHPGYGFLSENGDFAQACELAGLVFVGPSPDVLRQMGDKVTSRRIMREAGVPVVPGSADVQTDEQAAAFALTIGLPVMVKASGGGGGRGLRIVRRAKDLAPAIVRARSEALASFGSDAIYVEKLIEAPRHIEVQILADRHGNVVQLFERECSIQRRHQKLLEEAPGCGIDPTLRNALGDAALTAARAVGYVGAGTVEFLLDASGSFHFLEMNTRVQVEHPVTEEITGIDIVKEMLRVAAGEKLSFESGSAQIRGHAIEARIYAEDPANDFLPSPGVVSVFRTPGGPGIRVDAGVQAGDTVAPHYDALLAKLIAWAPTRPEAIARLDRALAEFTVGGIKTSIPFQRQVLAHPDFVAGRYDTSFVEHIARPEPDAALVRVAAALIAVAFGQDGAIRVQQMDQDALDARVIADTAEVSGQHFGMLAMPAGGGAWTVVVDGRVYDSFVLQKRNGRFDVRVGEQSFLFEPSEGA